MPTDHETTDWGGEGAVSLEHERRVDQLCNRFETAWKSGQRPSLEDYLDDCPAEKHHAILRELIPIDVHYRRRAGEEPRSQDYLNRFQMLERTWLEAVMAAATPGELSSTVAYRPVVPQVRSGKYTTKKFHARGGMGEIWLADDCEIGREVALKRIRQDRAKQRDRFLAEAQITGQMEHPGIVPVHELAQDENGLPFYVMKFVHGRSLKETIDEFHSPGRADEHSREVERLRLLEVFVALCHTVAYAHSRGVLHRDLKPDNVMVGEFGETLVVDWGLAKVMHQTELPGGGSYVHSTYTEHSGETQAGSVLGAPAYMAPEMAEGRSDEMDQRTDIYLLGSTLYSILTGQPPRRGQSHDEMIELARTVPPVPPRQLDRSIARALEAICLKAMAHRKPDRYQTAQELAEDVQRFVAGEPVSAYCESVPERAWRWGKRHRQQLAWSAAAVVLLAVTAVGGVKVHDAREAARQATEEAEKEKVQRELVEKQDTARQELVQFRNLVEDVQFYAASRDAVAERAPYFEPERALMKGREALAIADKWGHELQGLPLLPDEISGVSLKSEIYDLLLLMAQTSGGQAETRTEAKAWLDRARSLREPSRMYYVLRAEYLRADGDERLADDAQRQADDPNTPATALDHFLLGERHRSQSSPDPTVPHKIGQPNEELESAVDQYRKALERDAGHFWSHLQLGRCLFALSRRSDARRSEAIGSLSTAIALRPESPWGYTTRGLVFAMSNRFDDAIKDCDQALETRAGFRPALLYRGIAHWQAGHTSEALADFAAVLEPPDDQRLIEAAYYRALLYLDEKKHREALADLELLLRENPNFHATHLSCARAHFALGDELAGLQALNSFLKSQPGFDPESPGASAIRGGLLRRLTPGWTLPPSEYQSTMKLAVGELKAAVDRGVSTTTLFNDRGAIWDKAKQFTRAETEYSRGLDIDPTDVNLRNNRGWVYYELKQYDKARDDFAIAAQRTPDSPREFIARAESHSGLGLAYAALGAPVEALQEAGRAWMFLERGRADHHIVWHNIACIYGELSKASDDKQFNRYDELALEFLRRAVKSGGQSSRDRIEREKQFFPEWLRDKDEYQRLLTPTPEK